VLHALLMDALWRTIGDPHAHGGEGGAKGPLVPLRQLTRRHFAVVRTSSAGAES
jgi:hypothetical protein